MSKTTQPTVQQLKTTNRVYDLRKESKNDDILSETLGLSKVTLYTRLRRNNWKKTEIALINSLIPD